MIRRVLYKMDHTILSIYKKLCDLDRDLKQPAFYLTNTKISQVGYIIKGQRTTSATLKNSNVLSLFQSKTVSSPKYVLKTSASKEFQYSIRVNFIL